MEFKTPDVPLNASIKWFWDAFYKKHEDCLKIHVHQDSYGDTFTNNRRDLQFCVKGFVALACHALLNFLPVTKLLEEQLEAFSKHYLGKALDIKFSSDDKGEKKEKFSEEVAAIIPTTCKKFLQKIEGDLGAGKRKPLLVWKNDIMKLCQERARDEGTTLSKDCLGPPATFMNLSTKVNRYLEILRAIAVIVETAIKPEVVIPLVSNASIAVANDAVHQGRLSFEILKGYFKVAQVGEKMEDAIAEVSWAVKAGYPEREMIKRGSPQHLYLRPLLANEFEIVGEASKVRIFLLLKYFTTVTSTDSLENYRHRKATNLTT